MFLSTLRIKALVGLAFLGSIGLLFLFLGCALPGYNWYPFTVVIFYFLSPLPTLITKRYTEGGDSSALKDVCAFFTSGLVLSAFALPIVLARTASILWGSCAYIFASNVFMFSIWLVYFLAFDDEYALAL